MLFKLYFTFCKSNPIQKNISKFSKITPLQNKIPIKFRESYFDSRESFNQVLKILAFLRHLITILKFVIWPFYCKKGCKKVISDFFDNKIRLFRIGFHFLVITIEFLKRKFSYRELDENFGF